MEQEVQVGGKMEVVVGCQCAQVEAVLLSGKILISQSFGLDQKVVDVREAVQEQVNTGFEIMHGSQALQDQQILGECGLPDDLVQIQVVLCELKDPVEPCRQAAAPCGEEKPKWPPWYYKQPAHKRRAAGLLLVAAILGLVALACFTLFTHLVASTCGVVLMLVCLALGRCAVFSLRTEMT